MREREFRLRELNDGSHTALPPLAGCRLPPSLTLPPHLGRPRRAACLPLLVLNLWAPSPFPAVGGDGDARSGGGSGPWPMSDPNTTLKLLPPPHTFPPFLLSTPRRGFPHANARLALGEGERRRRRTFGKEEERTSLTVHCRRTPYPSPLPVALLTTVFPVPIPPFPLLREGSMRSND